MSSSFYQTIDTVLFMFLFLINGFIEYKPIVSYS